MEEHQIATDHHGVGDPDRTLTDRQGHQIADNAGALRRVELHPYLVAKSGVAHGRHDSLGGDRGRYIQCDDQTLTRIIHPRGV